MIKRNQHEAAWSVRHKLADQQSRTDKFVRTFSATPGKEDGEHSPPEARAPPGCLCMAGLCLLAVVAACLVLHPTLCCSQLWSFYFWGPWCRFNHSHLHSEGPGFRSPWQLGTELVHWEPSFPPHPSQNPAIWNPWFYEVSSGTLQSVVKFIWGVSPSKLLCKAWGHVYKTRIISILCGNLQPFHCYLFST